MAKIGHHIICPVIRLVQTHQVQLVGRLRDAIAMPVAGPVAVPVAVSVGVAVAVAVAGTVADALNQRVAAGTSATWGMDGSGQQKSSVSMQISLMVDPKLKCPR